MFLKSECLCETEFFIFLYFLKYPLYTQKMIRMDYSNLRNDTKELNVPKCSKCEIALKQ